MIEYTDGSFSEIMKGDSFFSKFTKMDVSKIKQIHFRGEEFRKEIKGRKTFMEECRVRQEEMRQLQNKFNELCPEATYIMKPTQSEVKLFAPPKIITKEAIQESLDKDR